MRLCFLAPGYPAEMPEFTRGLAQAGARVIGVSEGPASNLPDKARRALSDYIEVPRFFDEDDLVGRVTAALRARGGVERVETCWEPLVIAAARIRENLDLPGMSVDTVRGFRDKQLMKERVAAAGLRVPRSSRVRSAKEVQSMAESIGYPLCLKPISGAGSADTYKVGSAAELESVLARMGHVQEASCEEFIEGDEFTFDTLCVDGQPVYENVAWYLPKPIIARSEAWVSPFIVTMRDLDDPYIRDGVELGRKVLKALGMKTGFTHMEWFRKPDGEVVFGEIGCRPGGARLVDQMNFTGDIDLYRAYGDAIVSGRAEVSLERPYHCGVIFKRAQGQGRITHIQGLEDFMQRHGRHVLDETLLRPGTPRRDWKATLVSDGYILFRHPDWEQTLRVARDFQENVQLFAA